MAVVYAVGTGVSSCGFCCVGLTCGSPAGDVEVCWVGRVVFQWLVGWLFYHLLLPSPVNVFAVALALRRCRVGWCLIGI